MSGRIWRAGVLVAFVATACSDGGAPKRPAPGGGASGSMDAGSHTRAGGVGGSEPGHDSGSPALDGGGADARGVPCADDCSGQGECSDAICACDTGYAGSACERCATGFYRADGGDRCAKASCPVGEACEVGVDECANGKWRECRLDDDGCFRWTPFVECAPGTCSCATGDPGVRIEQWGTNKADTTYGLTMAPDGALIMTGIVGAELDGQPFEGMLDMFVAARYPASEREKNWSRQWGTPAADWARAVVADASGDLFVAGEVGAMIDGQPVPAGPAASLTRWDPNHTRAWTTVWAQTIGDYVYAVARHPSGDLFVGGTTAGEAVSGQTSAGGDDFILSRVTADGDVLWTHQWGTAVDDDVLAIAIDDAGDVYIAGTSAGDAFCEKMDADGQEIWTYTWTSNAYDAVFGIALLDDGEVCVAGHTGGDLGGTGAGGAFVSKLDAGGKLVFVEQLGLAMSDYARAIARMPGGDVLITGEVSGELVDGAAHGGDDAFVQRRTPDGDVVWTKQFGTASGERAFAIAVANDGTAYVAGSTNGAFAGFASRGSTDAFLITIEP